MSSRLLAHCAWVKGTRSGNSCEGTVAGVPVTQRNNSRQSGTLSRGKRCVDGVSRETSVTLARCRFHLVPAGGAAAGTKVSAVTGRGEHKDGGLLGPGHAGQKNARGPKEATGPRDAPRPWGSPGPPSHRHPSPPPPRLCRQSQSRSARRPPARVRVRQSPPARRTLPFHWLRRLSVKLVPRPPSPPSVSRARSGFTPVTRVARLQGRVGLPLGRRLRLSGAEPPSPGPSPSAAQGYLSAVLLHPSEAPTPHSGLQTLSPAPACGVSA